MSKGLSTWVWVIGGIIISLILFSFFFKATSDLTIETHRQKSLQNLDLLALDLDSLCGSLTMKSTTKKIILSDLVEKMYASYDGKDKSVGQFSHGNVVCIRFIERIQCKPVLCEIEMTSNVDKEVLLNLINKITGKFGYQEYTAESKKIGRNINVTIT